MEDDKTPNDTAHKPWSCHDGHNLLCKLCQNLPQWGPDSLFLASRPCEPAGWVALLLIKAGDVETNPGPTTTHKQVWICDICHKQVWICDICHKQIHGRKQISMSCNRIEHWVHLRCPGIRLAQYTDNRSFHLHKESEFTTHTDITSLHPSRTWSKPLLTYTTITQTQTHVQHSSCSHRIGKTQTQAYSPLTPLSYAARSKTYTSPSHAPHSPLIRKRR